MSEEIHYEDTVPGGCHWSMEIRKGLSLRFIDEEGGAVTPAQKAPPPLPPSTVSLPPWADMVTPFVSAPASMVSALELPCTTSMSAKRASNSSHRMRSCISASRLPMQR